LSLVKGTLLCVTISRVPLL